MSMSHKANDEFYEHQREVREQAEAGVLDRQSYTACQLCGVPLYSSASGDLCWVCRSTNAEVWN